MLRPGSVVRLQCTWQAWTSRQHSMRPDRGIEVPRLWQKMAMQLLANVDKNWVRKRMCVLPDFEGQRNVDNFWIMSHSESHREQMLKDLIQDAEKWDLAPKPASLWWNKCF